MSNRYGHGLQIRAIGIDFVEFISCGSGALVQLANACANAVTLTKLVGAGIYLCPTPIGN